MSVVALCMLTAALSAADTADVRQILTFEKAECLKYAGFKKVEEGKITVRYNTYGTYHYMRTGDATEGAWAVAKSFKKFAPMAGGYSENGLAAVQRAGRLLNGAGWMRRRGLVGDWSAYERLWIDVKSTDAKARIRVRVLDRFTVPVPERTFEIPAGAWVTLEFNLADAADGNRLERLKTGKGEALFVRCLESALYRARVLDPKDVQGLFVNALRVDAPSTLLVDNVRLVRAGRDVKPTLPLVTDDSPWPAFESLPATTTPPGATTRVPRPVSPGRETAAKPAEPTLIDLSKVRMVTYGRLHNDRCGIAVGDRSHMAITLEVGMDRCVLVTADGGRTWTGLKGSKAPTGLFGSQMMVGATSTPAADGADLLTVTVKHCSGGEEPSAVYFRRVRFTGDGWTAGPTRVIDVDSWHCPEHTMDVIRLANGRLWAAWCPTARVGGLQVVARYSDDDGATWRDLGSNGVIGGRRRPLLVPYGDGVACFRLKGWQDYVDWSHTDAGRWTKPTRIVKQTTRVTGINAGLALDEKTILVAMSGRRGKPGLLLRVGAGDPVEEKPPFTPARLSRAGDRVIGLAIREKRTIVMSVRSAAGEWGPAKVLATEDTDLMDLVVPAAAPGGFLPVMWAPRNHKWIKLLRVPLDRGNVKGK